MADDTQQINEHEPWLSIGEAAEYLGISRDTLRRWEKVGKVKVYRSPTDRRIYKQSDLEVLYKKQPAALAKHTEPKLPRPQIITQVQPAPPISYPPPQVVPDANIENTEPTVGKELEITVQESRPVVTQPPTPEIRPPEAVSPSPVTEQIISPVYTAPLQPPSTAYLPMTPVALTQSREEVSIEESSSTQMLKIVAIVLAMILILLGVTITILVFI